MDNQYGRQGMSRIDKITTIWTIVVLSLFMIMVYIYSKKENELKRKRDELTAELDLLKQGISMPAEADPANSSGATSGSNAAAESYRKMRVRNLRENYEDAGNQGTAAAMQMRNLESIPMPGAEENSSIAKQYSAMNMYGKALRDRAGNRQGGFRKIIQQRRAQSDKVKPQDYGKLGTVLQFDPSVAAHYSDAFQTKIQGTYLKKRDIVPEQLLRGDIPIKRVAKCVIERVEGDGEHNYVAPFFGPGGKEEQIDAGIAANDGYFDKHRGAGGSKARGNSHLVFNKETIVEGAM